MFTTVGSPEIELISLYVFLFPQKTHHKNLETTKLIQDDLCDLRDSVVSGFCVQNIMSLLSTFAGSKFCDFCGFLSVPLKSSRK